MKNRLFFFALLFVTLCPLAGLAKNPTNKKVEKDVDAITADEGYRWLREGGEKRETPFQPGKGKKGKHAVPNGNIGDVEDESGCGFDPNFKDWAEPKPDEPDDGCGNSNSPDCACNPDFGNCSCDPLIGNCGACVPSPGMLVPLGYVIAGLALALIIFLVVRALIKRMPTEDVSLESDEEAFDEEDMRVSRIHRVEPSNLLDRATVAAAAGDYKKAVGYLYLLALSILSRAGLVELDKSTTNWHILRQTTKNGGPIDAMRVIVRQFEDLYFGDKTPEAHRYELCRQHIVSALLPFEKEDTHAGS